MINVHTTDLYGFCVDKIIFGATLHHWKGPVLLLYLQQMMWFIFPTENPPNIVNMFLGRSYRAPQFLGQFFGKIFRDFGQGLVDQV